MGIQHTDGRQLKPWEIAVERARAAVYGVSGINTGGEAASHVPPVLISPTPPEQAAQESQNPAALPAAVAEAREQLAQKAKAARREAQGAKRQREQALGLQPISEPLSAAVLEYVQYRPVEPPKPEVVQRVELPEAPSAAALLAGKVVSAGAARVFLVLHFLATQLYIEHVRAQAQKAAEGAPTSEASRFRRAAALASAARVPDSWCFHCPAALVALLAEYSTKQLGRHVEELEALGLLDAAPQSEKVPGWQRKGRRPEAGKVFGMYTGTLYRVKLALEADAPRLTRNDYRTPHRDLERDTMCGRTPELWMSELQNLLLGQVPSEEQKKAAVLAFIQHNPLDVVGTLPTESVQDAVYQMLDLAGLTGTWQAMAVNRIARMICRGLNDEGWHAWWCKQLWIAIDRDDLQALSAQLQRLLVDAREWPEAQNLGAIFAARRKAA